MDLVQLFWYLTDTNKTMCISEFFYAHLYSEGITITDTKVSEYSKGGRALELKGADFLHVSAKSPVTTSFVCSGIGWNTAICH